MPTLKQVQFLPITLNRAWQFFATPANLGKITPDGIEFTITSVVPEKMHEGLLITYTIKAVAGIPMHWSTEITSIEEGDFFIDVQRKGPFKIWQHEHHFKEVRGGVEMTDILHYEIGKSIFGWIAGKLFVHRMVKEIFDYRYKKLETLFKKE